MTDDMSPAAKRSRAIRLVLTVVLVYAVWDGVWWAAPLAITLMAIAMELQQWDLRRRFGG